jgi:PAS domain S-box-containing protein
MNSSVQEQIRHRDDLIARILSKRVGSMFEKIQGDMRTASRYVLKDSEKDQEFYISEMQRFVSYDPLYLYVQAFDKDGKLLARVPDVGYYLKSVDFDYIQYRLSWSKTHYYSNWMTLTNDRPTVAVAYPALDERGEYQGGVVAFINLNVLSEYLKELNIEEKGINAVIDRNATVIGHSNPDKIGLSLKHHPLGNYLYKEKYGIWQGDLFSQNMMVAYRPFLLGNMGLIVGEPVEQAMKSSRHVMVLLFRGFMIVLFIAVALTLFGTSRVVKPIIQLIQQAKEYKENKRNHFDAIHTKDELQELTLTMDQMARELTNKERRLFYILESIPYGVITTDKNGIITTFNKGAEELTLFKREEVIGKYIIDLPLKENAEDFISWKTLQEGKEFDEIESYIFDKNRKKHDVKLNSLLFRGEDNKWMGAIIVIRDVSEIKKLEEYLKQNERLASLGQLTAGVAHEIKNPLSIIQAAAEAIHLETKETEIEISLIHEMTNDILESSDRMNRLLTDFLKLSKGEDDGLREHVNLVQILDELIYLLRKKMNDQDISIARQYEAKEAMVFADKNQLSQVFLNIFLNSLQAMETGGVLTIRIKDKQTEWAVEIEDTGKGIPPSKVQWIFNPFYSTKREGTGLGLSIAHEIMTYHNGKIQAESEEGKGTTMFIYIPKV